MSLFKFGFTSTASKEGAKKVKKIVEKQMSVFAGVCLGLHKD